MLFDPPYVALWMNENQESKKVRAWQQRSTEDSNRLVPELHSATHKPFESFVSPSVEWRSANVSLRFGALCISEGSD